MLSLPVSSLNVSSAVGSLILRKYCDKIKLGQNLGRQALTQISRN